MSSNRSTFSLTLFISALLLSFGASTRAHIILSVAGPNGTEPGSFFFSQWIFDDGHWFSGDPNEHDPPVVVADSTAAPMLGSFQSPTTMDFPGPVGLPSVLVDLNSGWTAPVWQLFPIKADDVFPEVDPSPPVVGWHAQILTPGWEWVLPVPETSDPSPINRDGLPWDWQLVDPVGGPDPARFSVEFPAIGPGFELGIHLSLLWRGTPENSVWGDELGEEAVEVLQYPVAIPEPTTSALALFALLCFIGRTGGVNRLMTIRV